LAGKYSIRPNKKFESRILPSNPGSKIKYVVAVMSGKGGVGKSTVSSLLGTGLAKKGLQVGILDADITGASIPKMFGLNSKITGNEKGILPQKTELGLKIISINLFLEHEDDPVIWRGSLVSKTIQQFWTDVVWGDLDYLVVDLPPGTGDVPLTVSESLPLNGFLIVTSPQELALMVVKKAVKMASTVNIPIMGLVENMSHVVCSKCGEKIHVLGKGKSSEAAERFNIPFWGKLPLDGRLSELCDSGRIEKYDGPYAGLLSDKLLERVTSMPPVSP